MKLNTWINVFFKEEYCKIGVGDNDEEIFVVLCSADCRCSLDAILALLKIIGDSVIVIFAEDVSNRDILLKLLRQRVDLELSNSSLSLGKWDESTNPHIVGDNCCELFADETDVI